MSADTVTVSVDREALLDLLAECHAVHDVLGLILGADPAATEALVWKLQSMEEVVFGPVQSDAHGVMVGAHVDLWDEGHRRADAFLRGFVAEAVTADAR